MIDGESMSDEILSMREESADAVLRHAVERIHGEGASYDWVGIYMLDGDELALHNFIGEPTEHTRIPVGRGVCGTAVAEGRDINVPDVRELENYLACSVDTRSEVVVLIRAEGDGRILGQIDIDSDTPAAFGPEDERELRKVADALGAVLSG
jgi:putative methionine-R-sulfoxide reductase with GAF domain